MTPTTPTKSPVDTIREALEMVKQMRIEDDAHVPLNAALSALSSLSRQTAQTMMSRDYEALYDLLCKGGEALGKMDDPGVNWHPRGIVAYRLTNQFGPIWHGLSADGKRKFIAECQRLNLEWVAPSQPAQTTDLERFDFDSAGLMEGSAEAWKEYSFDDKDRADERFRGSLFRVWKVAWIESRARLIGRYPLTTQVRELREAAQVAADALDQLPRTKEVELSLAKLAALNIKPANTSDL